MTSQVPFTPLTPGAVERLTLDEALAFEAATCAVAGDQKPSLEVVATLVLTVQRLITEPTEAKLAAIEHLCREPSHVLLKGTDAGVEGTDYVRADAILAITGTGRGGSNG